MAYTKLARVCLSLLAISTFSIATNIAQILEDSAADSQLSLNQQAGLSLNYSAEEEEASNTRDSKKQGSSEDSNDTPSSQEDEQKLIVIIFSSICGAVIIACVIIIVISAVRRNRIQRRRAANIEQRRNQKRQERGEQDSPQSDQKNKGRASLSQSGRSQRVRESNYLALSTVSEKSQEATITVSSSVVLQADNFRSNRLSHQRSSMFSGAPGSFDPIELLDSTAVHRSNENPFRHSNESQRLLIDEDVGQTPPTQKQSEVTKTTDYLTAMSHDSVTSPIIVENSLVRSPTTTDKEYPTDTPSFKQSRTQTDQERCGSEPKQYRTHLQTESVLSSNQESCRSVIMQELPSFSNNESDAKST